MSEIAVYGVPGSPYVRSVQLSLEEKGIAYALRIVSVVETKRDAHLTRHPFGRVPTFEHGDFRLYETQAILRYLEDVFPEPGLTPADPRARARMNQIIGINDCYFFPKVAAVIVGQRIVGPALLGMKTDEAAVAAAVPMGTICIAALDRLLGSRPFLAADQLTIADLILAPQLDFFVATPEGKAMVDGTRLQMWLERMNRRPSMVATRRPETLRGAA